MKNHTPARRRGVKLTKFGVGVAAGVLALAVGFVLGIARAASAHDTGTVTVATWHCANTCHPSATSTPHRPKIGDACNAHGYFDLDELKVKIQCTNEGGHGWRWHRCDNASPTPTVSASISPSPTGSVTASAGATSPVASASPTSSKAAPGGPLIVTTTPAGGNGTFTGDNNGLPVTGPPVLGIAAAGAILLAVGGGGIYLSRRRREPEFTVE